MHDALDLRELLGDEVIQRQESGYHLDAVLPQAEKVLQSDGPRWSAELEQAYRLLETASVRPDWPYQEPQDEAVILAIPSAAATTAPPGPNDWPTGCTRPGWPARLAATWANPSRASAGTAPGCAATSSRPLTRSPTTCRCWTQCLRA